MLPVHTNGNGSRTTDEDRNISCTLTPVSASIAKTAVGLGGKISYRGLIMETIDNR